MKATQTFSNKVFVGSVPGYYSSSDIAYFISPFGPIKTIKLDQKTDNPLMNRGFCVLTMRYARDAFKLLKQRQVYIGNGRYLICKPYLQGDDLHTELLEHDQKRVIIKHLPNDMPESYIQRFFEETVGQVELVFLFQSDDHNISPAHQTKRKRTASVTFFNSSDVNALFSDGFQEIYMDMWGIEMLVQKFKFQPASESLIKSEIQGPSNIDAASIPRLIENQLLSPNTIKSIKAKRASLKFKNQTARTIQRLNCTDALRNLEHEHDNVRFNLVKKTNNRENNEPHNLEYDLRQPDIQISKSRQTYQQPTSAIISPMVNH